MPKILVIEDESLLREEVMEWLVMAGYEAVGAADGLDGVRQALECAPDVILCDIAMPYLDGYGVMLQVRANALTQMIPFIYMTARVSLDDIRVGMNMGADDYITKPFTYDQVIQAVEMRLEKKAQHDMRQQAEVEQWQQALAEEHDLRILKSRMVAMFSHDFRNPLATILSSNGILRDHSDRLDPQRRLAFFNRIEASVHRLTQMVEDMLTIAQMEAGKLSFKPETLNIAEFLQQIVEEFQLIYGDTHTLTFRSQLSDLVQSDPHLLRQIATNLISNAVKYSPKDKEVLISLQRNPHGLELIVQDHGIGIPDADQQNLFKAFQRASNVGSIAGTGLGLAIVQQAAALHGGSVELESQVNVGTTVTVCLPLALY